MCVCGVRTRGKRTKYEELIEPEGTTIDNERPKTILRFLYFSRPRPTPTAATTTTITATTTTRNDILSVRFREPPPVECVQHMLRRACVWTYCRYLRSRRIWLYFSRSKLNTHAQAQYNNDHTTWCVFFFFFFKTQSPRRALNRVRSTPLLVIWYIVFGFFSSRIREWRVALFIKFIVCCTRTGLVSVPR